MIVFGSGSLERLPDLVRELGSGKPMLVLDGHLSGGGFRERVEGVLSAGNMSFGFFDRITGEPELGLADECAALCRDEGCDSLVGIGGGSTLDVAKAAAVIVSNGGEAKDYLGLNKVPGPGLPKIMVPTTAGTGSEVTFTSVFIRSDLKKKEGMNSPYLYPELALLDPLLTLSVPAAVTATTGMDALCHAIESYTSINANPMSEMISLKAVELISSNLRTCVHNGGNLDARENMLLGSLYAGIGLANAGVTAVHSLSYPLGGKYGVPHGLANTILLAPVMKYNLPGALEKFAVIAGVMGAAKGTMSRRGAAYAAVEAVRELIRDCGIDTTISKLGISEDEFPALAETAMTVKRPLDNNPRRMTEKDAIAMYREAY